MNFYARVNRSTTVRVEVAGLPKDFNPLVEVTLQAGEHGVQIDASPFSPGTYLIFYYSDDVLFDTSTLVIEG